MQQNPCRQSLNIFFFHGAVIGVAVLRTLSSVGQSDRLIPGKSQVRVLQGPLRCIDNPETSGERKTRNMFSVKNVVIAILISVVTLDWWTRPNLMPGEKIVAAVLAGVFLWILIEEFEGKWDAYAKGRRNKSKTFRRGRGF